jgi:APA family basic amino acid/polyamine antiporter
VFVFRRRAGSASGAEGSFRLPGYPVVPLLFIAAAVFVVASVVVSNPKRCAAGVLLLATGVPAYFVGVRRRSRRMES